MFYLWMNYPEVWHASYVLFLNFDSFFTLFDFGLSTFNFSLYDFMNALIALLSAEVILVSSISKSTPFSSFIWPIPKVYNIVQQVIWLIPMQLPFGDFQYEWHQGSIHNV